MTVKDLKDYLNQYSDDLNVQVGHEEVNGMMAFNLFLRPLNVVFVDNDGLNLIYSKCVEQEEEEHKRECSGNGI